MRLTASAGLLRQSPCTSLPASINRPDPRGGAFGLAIASLALSGMLGSCGAAPEANTPETLPIETTTAATLAPTETVLQPSVKPGSEGLIAPPPNNFELGLFSQEELFAAGSGGCGLSLQPTPEAAQDQAAGGFLLFHGVDGSPMLMKINGKLVPFKFEEGRGAEFYGQTPSQTFSNTELKLIAIVEADPGNAENLGEAESIPIPSGSVQLQAGTETIAIPVEGKAGC